MKSVQQRATELVEQGVADLKVRPSHAGYLIESCQRHEQLAALRHMIEAAEPFGLTAREWRECRERAIAPADLRKALVLEHFKGGSECTSH